MLYFDLVCSPFVELEEYQVVSTPEKAQKSCDSLW